LALQIHREKHGRVPHPSDDVPPDGHGDAWEGDAEPVADDAHQRNGHSNRNGKPTQENERPTIDADTEDLPLITPQAWAALLKANNPPSLFRFSGIASRIESDDSGNPTTKNLTVERATYHLARAARWQRTKKVGKEIIVVDSRPPRAVVEDLLATPDSPLPVLTRIIQAPMFGRDGTLHLEPGYCPTTSTYYHPADGFELPDVPEHPGDDEVQQAVKLLCEMIDDFPFVSDAERAHALAATILPFVRDLIAGPTPLHLFEAPSPGTGKTLLVDVLAFPALGREVSAMTEGKDEDEWRKRLFAKLRGAPAVVLLDNLRRQLDSSALASVLTAYPHWEDRILGVSETAAVPVRCTWMATGNNPSLSNEMARRTIRIRLDAKVERPWQREGFRHPNLREWVAENRAQIVRAILVMVRAWLDAGRPEGQKTIGMYENWAKVIGGILDVAKVPGFLGNLEKFYEAVESGTSPWFEFLLTWHEQHDQNETTTADLMPIALGCGLVDDNAGRSQRVRLGRMLAEHKDRVFTLEKEDRTTKQVRLEQAGTYRRAAKWKLTDV
jgi:hypothetical protein